MRPDTLLLLYAFLAVLALIVLIAGFKLHPFVVLVAVSLALGPLPWARWRGCRCPAS